jgi:hypothetical protein
LHDRIPSDLIDQRGLYYRPHPQGYSIWLGPGACNALELIYSISVCAFPSYRRGYHRGGVIPVFRRGLIVDKEQRLDCRNRYDYDGFKPWDETYRGTSGWDNSGRGYYFATGIPEVGAEHWGSKGYTDRGRDDYRDRSVMVAVR